IDLATTRVKDELTITDVKVQGAHLEVKFPDSEYYTYNIDNKGWVEGALSNSLILSDLKQGNHKIEFRRISTTNNSAPSQVVEFKSYQQYLDYFFLVIGIALGCAIVFAIPVLKFTPDIYRIYLFVVVALFIGLLFLNNHLAIIQFKNQFIIIIPILVLAPLFYKFQRMVFRKKSISGEGELDKIYLRLRGFEHGSMNRSNLFRFIRLINHFKYKGKGSGLEKNLDETIEVTEQYVLPEMDDILKQLMNIGKYYLEAKKHRRVLGRTHRKDLRCKILSGKFDYVSTKELEQTYELFKMVRNELTEKFYNCDFFQCCRDVIAEFEGEFQKKGVTFNSDIDEGRDTKVIIKSYELCKILENLIENALAAMEGQPEKRLQLEVTEEDADLTLKVTDTGHGIAKDIYGQVFEKNFTTKESKSGGLGLYYSRETLTNYNGTIQIVESEKEHGTTMQLKLKILVVRS
nr:GHKL domain-containing protein [bacterium]